MYRKFYVRPELEGDGRFYLRSTCMECGMVFDIHGTPIYWHVPINGSTTYIPDSKTLWNVFWEHKNEIGGFVHTHPWMGRAYPSRVDITTFEAVEFGLGKRLVWPILTFSELKYFCKHGESYIVMKKRRFRIQYEYIKKLIELSGGEEDGKIKYNIQRAKRGLSR